MSLSVDGADIQTYDDVQGNFAGRQFVRYDYVSATKLTVDQIRFNFLNDSLINGEDRNLYVDKIVLDGTVYESEGPGIYSLGSWSADTGCAAGYKASETLSCNGYFMFR